MVYVCMCVCVYVCRLLGVRQSQTVDKKATADFMSLLSPENLLRLCRARPRGCWTNTGFLVPCYSMTGMRSYVPHTPEFQGTAAWTYIQGQVYSGWHAQTPILSLKQIFYYMLTIILILINVLSAIGKENCEHSKITRLVLRSALRITRFGFHSSLPPSFRNGWYFLNDFEALNFCPPWLC